MARPPTTWSRGSWPASPSRASGVIPTRRLLLGLLLSVALAAIGGVGGLAGAALGIFILAAAVVDTWIARRDLSRLSAVRQVRDKLSLGAWNPVRVDVASQARRPLAGWLRDTPPASFGLSSPPWMVPVRVPPAGSPPSVGLDYAVRPSHRGDESFDRVYARVLGPLGLAAAQRSLPGTEADVRVYPSLRDLRRYDLLARRGLQLESGSRRVRRPGAGMEFERLREYAPDDEFRRINWKATARRGAPIVNEFEPERSQNLVIMLDAGRLMAARVDPPGAAEADALVASDVPMGLSKLDHALNAALLLAHVGTARGDRVALLSYTDAVRRYVPPERGRHAFLRMVDAFYTLRAEPVEADHAAAFAFLGSRRLRRSLVVLFTDVVDRASSEVLLAHVLRAARQHLVVCVTLNDPTIVLPAGRIPSNAQEVYEKLVAQRLLDERAEVLRTMASRGVVPLDTPADALSPRLIQTYLDLKERGRI